MNYFSFVFFAFYNRTATLKVLLNLPLFHIVVIPIVVLKVSTFSEKNVFLWWYIFLCWEVANNHLKNKLLMAFAFVWSFWLKKNQIYKSISFKDCCCCQWIKEISTNLFLTFKCKLILKVFLQVRKNIWKKRKREEEVKSYYERKRENQRENWEKKESKRKNERKIRKTSIAKESVAQHLFDLTLK